MTNATSITASPYGRQVDRSRGEAANVLAVAALFAVAVAYLTMFAVLGDTNYAVKFENGELPAGFDGSGGQVATVVSLGAVLFAFVAVATALGLRATKLVTTVAVVGLVAAVPYALLEFVTWQLAF